MIRFSAELLSVMSEPALLAKGGRILYANTAAQELFGPDCCSKSFRQLFGAEIAGMQAPSFAGEAEIAGQPMLLQVKTVEGMRVVVLSPCSRINEQVGDAFLFALRSELMQIGVSLTLLQGRSDLTETETDAARTITRCLFRVNRTLQNLNVIRGVETGSILFHPQPLDLSVLLRDLVDSVRALLTGPEIVLNLPQTAPVSGDPEILEQLLLNLLSNALRHAEGCTRIRVILHSAGEQYILSVCDDGCGIPEENMRMVMERYRTGGSPGDAARGSGLGLSAVRCIARLHGGTLMLESRKDSGVSVRVSLHRAPRALTPLQSFSPDFERSYDAILTGLSDCLPSEAFDAPFRER